MSKNSSPPRHESRPRKAAQLLEEPPNAIIKYTEESSPMSLDGAMKYFSSCLPKAFRVSEGVYSPKGRAGVAKGDIFIVHFKEAASFLKLKSGNVTIPVVTQTEFALTPPNKEGNETDAAVRNWEGAYQSVTEFFKSRQDQCMPVPAALKVLDNALDHNRQAVPAKTILFNIRQVSQRVGIRKRCGIEGVDSSGTVHRFLEGEDPLYFSTRLFDVKCIPGYFPKVLQFPQTARVYLNPNTEEEEEEVNLLQNLSTVTITEVCHGHHLVVRKLSDSGDGLGPTFTVPWDTNLKVVAINLKDSHLLDNISDQECTVGAKSFGPTDSQADISSNHYYDDPCSEVTRGDVQEGRKGCQLKESYYNAETLKLKKHHLYFNMQVAVAFVPSHVSTGSTAAGASDQDSIMMGDTQSVDESDIYEYMPGSKTASSVTPHGKKLPLDPGSPAQPIAVPCKDCKTQKDSRVACLGNASVTPARMGDSHQLSCLGWQKLRSVPGRGINEAPGYANVQIGIPTQSQLMGPPPPPPQHAKLKHRMSLPPQPPPVLQCPQKADSDDDHAYEEVNVEDLPTQQGKVPVRWKLPQPQASRSPPPVAPAHPDHSTKPKPKGVPSTAIPLAPVPSTRAPQRPPVSKKPIMLTSCPKEPELRYHVAAKLGRDWRSVCTYLGLQHYQLEQADEAHSLEDKAMEALVMWLRGQEELKAPRSWNTLLQALRWAGQSDMASDVERRIKNGTLQLTQSIASRDL